MKERRVFVAILPPEDVRQQIVDWQESHPDLDVHWKAAERLHITIIAPWNVHNDHIRTARGTLADVARFVQPFVVAIRRVRWGPPSRTASASLVWAGGETPREFAALKRRMEDSLLSTYSGLRTRRKFPTILHTTVGRLPTSQPRVSLPNLDEDVSWVFLAHEFCLIESIGGRNSRKYRLIERFDFA